MEKKFKLGVVGAGFMASAIINGALNSGFLTPEQVIVSDLQTEKLYKLKERGLHITTDNLSSLMIRGLAPFTCICDRCTVSVFISSNYVMCYKVRKRL